MKTLVNILCSVLFIQGINAQQKALDKIWESKDQLPVPESVLFVPEKNELYVSLIDGEGATKDGKGGLAILNLDGSLKQADWITGLNAPKGLALYRDLLYIADISSVVVVDVVTGNIVNEIEIAESTFLNDVTVDDNGVVYVSDTRQNKIFQIKGSRYTLYMDNVPSVNGLKFVNDNLYALAGPELWKIDANKNKTVLATGFEKGGDGLEPVGNGDFLVTCWAGLIYYVRADGSFQKMLDVQGNMNTADLGYNPKEQILYIPTFNSNSVVAYKLK
ncbi:SMP-30/gluconolactonase/LRE family protein [Sphingobacterium pedocola]|uniref:ATP-binding protein n=1 Tax=Sphingobacterium pedocola TaxID=2082722 RepID=A0ABR9T9S8_9SPHI|nr:ATP-binding protein [Sphingobacterium pedocola]MBE8721387.1 ATP-binding protein [Sphingobacterium pedocola]